MDPLLSTRLSTAREFLLQSPPGELNDVFNDLRTIVANDEALERDILPALKMYNLQQYTTVQLQGEKKKVMVNEVSKLEEDAVQLPEQDDQVVETHVDWSTKQCFDYDHMKSTASNLRPIPTTHLYDSETLSILSSIEPLLQKHVENHYSEGVSGVWPLKDERYTDQVSQESRSGEKEEEEEPKEMMEEKEKGEGEVGTLSEGLNPESAAETAAETAEAAEEAIKEGVEGEDTSMKVATPAADADEEVETKEGEKQEVESNEEVEEEKKVEKPLKSSRLFGLYLVGNKYNPNNYWTGRWRSNYIVDYEKGTIDGTAMINIHYYEQGNVQLSTTLTSHSLLSPSPSPQQIIASLKSSEQSFSASLSSTYGSLSEDTFRGLRRALPKTRSKIDWAKAASYKLGQHLSGAN